jgi:hypothetical protein
VGVQGVGLLVLYGMTRHGEYFLDFGHFFLSFFLLFLLFHLSFFVENFFRFSVANKEDNRCKDQNDGAPGGTIPKTEGIHTISTCKNNFKISLTNDKLGSVQNGQT